MCRCGKKERLYFLNLKRNPGAVLAFTKKLTLCPGGMLRSTYQTMAWQKSFHWETWVETHLLSIRHWAAQQKSQLRCSCRSPEAEPLQSRELCNKNHQTIASCLLIFGISRGEGTCRVVLGLQLRVWVPDFHPHYFFGFDSQVLA